MFANLFGKMYLLFHIVFMHISVSVNKDKYIYKMYKDTQVGFLFWFLFHFYCSTCLFLFNIDLRVISW